MLTPFDWLRRARTGAELLVLLKLLDEAPERFPSAEPLGPPLTALFGPCQRCGVYPPAVRQAPKLAVCQPGGDAPAPSDSASEESINSSLPGAQTGRYCRTCQAIMKRRSAYVSDTHRGVLVWGCLNRLPVQLSPRQGFYQQHLWGAYLHDKPAGGPPYRFLLAFSRKFLREWLRELLLYHGPDLTGLLQIFPPNGVNEVDQMGDLLTRIIAQDIQSAPDSLRVHFYAAPYQVVRSRQRERQGMLSFDAAEFLRLLEMAIVFRTMLLPDQQEMLLELLTLRDPKEEGFYWGRFLGMLTPTAKDMLDAWRIRAWPRERVRLLYELTRFVYVDFSQSV